jgi:hypothetical protein
MGRIIGIAEGVFILLAAVYFTLFLTGKLKYAPEQEEKRKKRVKKYGWLLKPITILSYLFGSALVFISLLKYIAK